MLEESSVVDILIHFEQVLYFKCAAELGSDVCGCGRWGRRYIAHQLHAHQQYMVALRESLAARRWMPLPSVKCELLTGLLVGQPCSELLWIRRMTAAAAAAVWCRHVG